MHIDENSAGTILGQLDDDPPVPSIVDIERAVGDGRRRRRVRRAAGYGAVAGAAALVLAGGSVLAGTLRGPGTHIDGSQQAAASAPVPKAPPAPTACALHMLPLPDGRTMALVTGGDPTGRFLLGRSYPANVGQRSNMGLHVIIWDRRKATLVAVPGDDQSLNDINSLGVAVGNSWAKSGEGAYYYRAGKVSQLPGGTGAEVRAINDAGTAVGSRGGKPVLWASVTSGPVNLALPSGATGGAAFDIDEDGTVIGTVSSAGPGSQEPYVWLPDGSGHRVDIPTNIPIPTVSSPAAKNPDKSGARTASVPVATAYHIRDGWLTGRVYATAVRWNLRTGEVRTFPDFDTAADAINRYGWQVGIDMHGGAIFVGDGGSVALPGLAASAPGSLANIPSSISDDGKVIGGQSDDKTGVIRAVAWTCS